MTCKDTPLRQHGHMEVLQWLLGKRCGARKRGMSRELNVVQHKTGHRKKTNTNQKT